MWLGSGGGFVCIAPAEPKLTRDSARMANDDTTRQRDAAHGCLTAARRHFDVLRLERGWGREEDEPMSSSGGGGGDGGVSSSVLGRALSSLWPSSAASGAAVASAAAVTGGGDGGTGGSTLPSPPPPPPVAANEETPPPAERLAGLGLGLLGSERGEDEWEYPDAVEERLDALEREGRGVGAGGGRAAPQEEGEEGGLLEFILDDYDVGENGVNTEYWETWGAYAEWNEEEEAEVGQ